NSPFRLNLHVRDLGHTIMFGPTGAGKSTALGILVAQLRRYEGMTIFAFDKGQSLYALTSACGGQHYTIAGDEEELNFCPLQHLETSGDQAWALDWIDTILALNGVQTSPNQRNGISAALVSMAATGGRSLSDFVASIQDTSIREALLAYTVDGSMGTLLDAEEDGLAFAHESNSESASVTTFEIEDLMNLENRWVLPILLYLFRRIERALKGQPACIVLDEAWLVLDHPVFREKIREWFKVLRKANCALILATQNLSDAANSGIFDAILESTATKIYLPNVYARNPETAAVYLKMGLNRQQLEIIASATPKRDYYLVSEKGSRLFNFEIGPLAMAFVGVSDKETVAQIRVLEKQFGSEWVDFWLKSKKLSLDNTMEIH
ncbi:MAG: conjugal transfer protein TrbE, partial [Bilophila sp.]